MSLNIYDAVNSKLDKVQTKNNITPVSITIAENGTYTALPGTAYTPVIVNVQGGTNIGIVDETAYVGEATIQE